MNDTEMTQPLRRKSHDKLQAGALVLLGAVVVFGFIFLIGRQQQAFARVAKFSVAFRNVEGLQVESPVWLGGLEVGRVVSIALEKRDDGRMVSVQFEIMHEHADWVKEDTTVRITSRGLLGDKALDVTLGSSERATLPPGSELSSLEAESLDSLMAKSGQLIAQASQIVEKAHGTLEDVVTPSMVKDVHQTVRSVRHVVDEVRSGHGMVHAILYDVEFRREVESILSEAQKGTAEFRQAAEQISLVAQEVELGPLLATLNSAAEDVKGVTAKVREGEGSLGALINDPTVYEDLKQVLGNLRRNRVLRAMVRYLMTNGDALEQTGPPPKNLSK